MKKFTTLVATVLSVAALAQHDHDHKIDHTILDPLNQQVCGANMEAEYAFAENPALRIQDEIDQANFEIEYQNYLQTYDPHARAAYIVPCVVHIVHEGGAENISDEQVYDAIMRLNEDFSMTNDDLSNAVPAFIGITGNTDVEFRLATKDPNGNCHPGITRTFTAGGGAHDVGDNGDVRDAVQAEHGNWPQNKYMNIFVVKNTIGAAAYTNKPGNWYSASGMGGSIYMTHTYMGSMGTSSMSNRHVLAHEVGHWLNLSHTWGNNNNAGESGSCSTDDGVSDTPNTIGWLGICQYDGQTCGSLDNVQNIMDYAGSCRCMFTEGQSARMQTSLNSSVAQRNNLWTTSNLQATGVYTPAPICEATFSSNITVVCAGGSVEFTDESYHNVTSRSWSFQGGTPSTSSAENPIVTYNTPGIYDVSLQASDGTNMMTNTSTDYIVVLSDPGTAPPYHEGFEATSAIPDNDTWMVYDEQNNGTWDLTFLGGAGGTFHSARLDNFGNSDGSIDELISGSIDLSGVSPSDQIVFTFEYAYRKRNPSNDEWLRFYISNDCGETWVLRKNWHGDGLSPLTQTTPYIGGGPSEWYFTDVTSINSAYFTSDFRFKFQFENDGGNNLYIDNINLYPATMTDIVETEENFSISIYPNPANDMTTVQLAAKSGQDYSITILSALGQVVDVIHQGELNNGINQIEYNTADLAKGVYVIRIESEGRLETVKLIKE